MHVNSPIDVVAVDGEIKLQRAVQVPANTMQPFRFKLEKGQKLSGFYNKIEHGSAMNVEAILTSFLPIDGQVQPGPILAHANRTGAGQRVLAHSDTGASGSLNLQPDVWYYATWYWTDGLAHQLVLAYGDGGE